MNNTIKTTTTTLSVAPAGEYRTDTQRARLLVDVLIENRIAWAHPSVSSSGWCDADGMPLLEEDLLAYCADVAVLIRALAHQKGDAAYEAWRESYQKNPYSEMTWSSLQWSRQCVANLEKQAEQAETYASMVAMIRIARSIGARLSRAGRAKKGQGGSK